METVNGGYIEVIVGCMFSGKTKELLRLKERAELAQRHTVLFKPQRDDRYATDDVITHDEISQQSHVVADALQIEEMVLANGYDYVFIDEGQFFDHKSASDDFMLVTAARKMADAGKEVYIAGLNMDFRGQPFEVMMQLMAIAEFPVIKHAICVECGHLANFSHRMSDSQERIQTGGRDIYQALCRRCFNNKQRP